MVYKGLKVEREGYTLEVTKVSKLTEDVESVDYEVRKGSRVLTEGFIYLSKNDDANTRLKEVLESIVKAVKRVSQG